jgi:hypothetical protein
MYVKPLQNLRHGLPAGITVTLPLPLPNTAKASATAQDQHLLQ